MPLQNVGRHLPLNGMRTCRLVCKRWAAVIGESVTAVGITPEQLRAIVLSDDATQGYVLGGGPDTDSEGEGCRGPAGNGGQDPNASDVTGAERTRGLLEGVHGVAGSTTGGTSVVGHAHHSAAAMRKLRLRSRRLARAFPRAHTCVVHVDVGCVGGPAPAGRPA
jgi:hypothetical protein